MDILKTILENEEYLKDFITRSTYNSNAIDGNKLTLTETRELLYCDMNLKINADGRSINEAINHKSAMEYVFLNINNYISNPTIENINNIINGNIKEFFLPDCGKKLNINLFLNMEDYENFEKRELNYTILFKNIILVILILNFCSYPYLLKKNRLKIELNKIIPIIVFFFTDSIVLVLSFFFTKP